MTRGMLPAALVDPTDAEQLELAPLLQYLTAAAHGRGGALSVGVAWNCLAFEYDLVQRRYTSDLIDVSTLPVVARDATIDPVPTGALVALMTGAGPVSAEVVHREGAHPGIGPDGSCPGWLSGAPAGAAQPGEPTEQAGDSAVLVDELLTLDAYALGADRPEKLRRLHGRWLDDLGHLLVQARYRTAELAEQPEVRQYASYLVNERNDVAVGVLERAGLRPSGAEWTTGELTARLQTSLLAVDELLTLAGLVRWRDQAVDPQVFDAQLDADTRDDLHRLVTSLARRALPPTRRFSSALAGSPAYLALGPHLRSTYGDRMPEKVSGRAYPAMLAAASGTLTEHMEGLGRATVVDGQRVHVRLDDAWQGGGIWRACTVTDNDELADVDLPLSLGWFGAVSSPTPPASPGTGTPDDTSQRPDGSNDGDSENQPPPGDGSAEQPGDQPETPPDAQPDTPPDAQPDGTPDQSPPDSGAEPEPVTVRSDATTCTWTFALTARHQNNGTVPLTALVSEQMEDAGLGRNPVRMVLSHPGSDIDAALLRQSVTLSGRTLTGMRWPEQMFTGIKLTASWIVEGSVVDIHSTPLDEPKICDGIPLDYDFDEEVVLRSWGTPQDLDLDSTDPISPAQVLRLLRQYGRRVPQTVPLTLVAGLAELHNVASTCGHECTLDELAYAVDALATRSTMTGSVLVQWGRWVDAHAAGERYRRPRSTGSRTGADVHELAVMLSLAVKGSGRPSRAPVTEPEQPQDVAGALRRAHLRWTGAPVSPERRAMVRAWAIEHGYNPDNIHPYQTFVRSARVRAYRRGNR